MEKALIAWVEDALNIKALWFMDDAFKGNTRSKRLPLPYVTLNITSLKGIGGPDRTPGSGVGEFDIKRHKEFTLSINIYADNNHLGLMETLEESLDYESVNAAFRAVNLAHLRTGDPLDTSELLETKNEFRVTMDAFFGYAKTTTDTPGEIDKAEIEYDYESGRQSGTLTVERP